MNDQKTEALKKCLAAVINKATTKIDVLVNEMIDEVVEAYENGAFEYDSKDSSAACLDRENNTIADDIVAKVDFLGRIDVELNLDHCFYSSSIAYCYCWTFRNAFEILKEIDSSALEPDVAKRLQEFMSVELPLISMMDRYRHPEDC